MKRLAASIVLSSLLGIGWVTVADLGTDSGLAVGQAEAQARTKRTPRTKVGTKQVAPTPPAQAPVACGGEGRPKCPLEAWMETNIEAAAENGDLPRLAELYTKIAGWAPNPAWNSGPTSWRAIAETAATKAREGDTRGARAACKQCHRAWRDRYRAEYPGRPVPSN